MQDYYQVYETDGVFIVEDVSGNIVETFSCEMQADEYAHRENYIRRYEGIFEQQATYKTLLDR